MPDDNPLFAILEAALEKEPGQSAVRKHLATLLLDADKPEMAIEHLNRLKSETPDDGEVGVLLGRAYRALADHYGAPSTSSPTQFPPPNPPTHRQEEGDGDADESPFPMAPSSLKLSDVAGLTAVKTRLDNSFLKPFRNPELQKAYGVSGSGGLLLYGPPGCGKTFIARAIAGELMARFYAINVLDVASPFFGESEGKLYELFQLLRRNRPSVAFFDEIDALGRKRSLTRESGRSITTVLLEQMDGMDAGNDGLFFVAATNHPWDVDVALRRPGRFDRTLFVAPPDRAARRAILVQNLEGKPHEGIDLDQLAERSHGFSGADVKHLVTTAAEYALVDAIDSSSSEPIGMRHFKKALSEVKPSIRGWLESAKNYALFANDGGQYDELAEYLKEHKVI